MSRDRDDQMVEDVAKAAIQDGMTIEQLEKDFKPDSLAALLLRSDFDDTSDIIYSAIMREEWPNQSRWGDMARSDWTTICHNAIFKERVFRKAKELLGK